MCDKRNKRTYLFQEPMYSLLGTYQWVMSVLVWNDRLRFHQWRSTVESKLCLSIPLVFLNFFNINSFCNIDRMFSISFAINGMFLEKSRESYDLLFVVWERVKKQGTEQRNDRNSFLFFLLLPPTPAVFLLWLFLPCALLNLTLESSNCHLSFSVHAIGSDWHYWLVID